MLQFFFCLKFIHQKKGNLMIAKKQQIKISFRNVTASIIILRSNQHRKNSLCSEQQSHKFYTKECRKKCLNIIARISNVCFFSLIGIRCKNMSFDFLVLANQRKKFVSFLAFLAYGFYYLRS